MLHVSCGSALAPISSTMPDGASSSHGDEGGEGPSFATVQRMPQNVLEPLPLMAMCRTRRGSRKSRSDSTRVHVTRDPSSSSITGGSEPHQSIPRGLLRRRAFFVAVVAAASACALGGLALSIVGAAVSRRVFAPHRGAGSQPSSSSPQHLVVLQHGLSGTVGDLSRLARELQDKSGGEVLVHSAGYNAGRNLDGVSAGGRRLAQEIVDVVNRHSSLSRISLVGNSLGGLYTRYALAELFEKNAGLGSRGRIAGLAPEAFVTIGCPHLGVRRFTFVAVPQLLRSAAGVLVGRTGEDLMLRDRACLLERMAAEDGGFLEPLRAFNRRGLYANLWGDFMVPFGTAAFEPSWGSGLLDEQSVSTLLRRPGIEVVDREVLERKSDGIALRWDVAASASDAASVRAMDDDDREAAQEVEMAANLERCGWSKFAVGFRSTGTFFPMAHNKLAAVERSGWRKWAFSWLEGTTDGDSLMGEIAAYILDSPEDSHRRFLARQHV
eukprot:CAMPEP_0204109966 /NCGR_PEP_ID=MMETSP0361-20130328/1611_1 /ASSEMBLY_ACC=CAM_ASM_000343 /TAXON_ID=268821 /ORGANISM="Scrippsiella Hangoei, Strain SHTV-5" /LENGTH=494 /DNA_ID=CAMNT_0051059813 /DNA_START=87 /DNA_END=1567 /DNA_ORIENTATION=+